MDIIGQLILIILLTGLNAFFAAAEMALVSVDRISVENELKKGNKKAGDLLKVIDEPNSFLATIQVGITLAGFLSSASAATSMSDGVATILNSLHIPYSEQLSVIIITMILSYFILVFGELLPKQIALGKAETVAYRVVRPIKGISYITFPFVKLLTASVNGLMKLFRVESSDEEEEVSEERIRMLVSLGRQRGKIKRIEEVRINKIFELDDLKVAEVMLPLEKVFFVDLAKQNDEYIKEVISKKYTRMPIIREDKKHPIGILLLKDFLEEASKSGFDKVDIESIMKEPYVIDSHKQVDKLLLEMQRKRKHLAIVVNEAKECVGIVTIEDLIEEVFGEIRDEFDSE